MAPSETSPRKKERGQSPRSKRQTTTQPRRQRRAMEIKSEAVRIGTGEGEMPCHLGRPAAAGRYPGVIVVMEAFGLNRQIKAVAERLAGEGYVTLAPDLYYRFGSPVVPYGDVPRAIEHMRKLDDPEVMADAGACLAYLRRRSDVRADRLGVVGFCMGGTIAFKTAAHHAGDVKAAVSFYGGGSLAADQDLLARIGVPVLALWAEQDSFIPLDLVRRVEETMRSLGKAFESTVYPRAGHGFFCEDRDSYHHDSAQDSWLRLTQWFHKYLK